MAESVPTRLSLEHLAALNDEIAALARAGMPLERGLLAVGRDVPGNLSAAMVALGNRMSAGSSLAEAMAAEGSRFPTIYRAVVEAGLRAGRLPAALESVASFIRSYVEARRVIGLALLYPLIVLVLAYALFVLMLTQVVPRFVAAFESLQVPVSAPLAGLVRLGATAVYWGPVVPVVMVAALLAWAWSGAAVGFPASRGWSPLRFFPWMGSLLKEFEAAGFAELLAVLLEQGVPLHEALVLASEASGDPSLVRSSRDIASSIERGAPFRVDRRGARAIPPLLRWLLSTGRQQVALVAALRQGAAMYRKRAQLQAEKIRIFLPTVFLLGIGATATLLYALTLFIPFTALLRGLAAPVL